MWNWEFGIRRGLEDWETGEHRRSFFALQATQDRRGGVEGQLKKDEGRTSNPPEADCKHRILNEKNKGAL